MAAAQLENLVRIGADDPKVKTAALSSCIGQCII